jgi:glycosyltransferase involved in cell wall biosynthesis
MPSFYLQGDAVALLSISEGFGLGLIEGMHYGLPCISFDDIDAFEDIYNSDAMVGIAAHDDNAVAEGLHKLVTDQWDKNIIIEVSRKFESDKMAANYLECFSQVIT